MGNGRKSTASTTLNMAVLAATPRARIRTATILNPGLLTSTRKEYRMSRNRGSIAHLRLMFRSVDGECDHERDGFANCRQARNMPDACLDVVIATQEKGIGDDQQSVA